MTKKNQRGKANPKKRKERYIGNSLQDLKNLAIAGRSNPKASTPSAARPAASTHTPAPAKTAAAPAQLAASPKKANSPTQPARSEAQNPPPRPKVTAKKDPPEVAATPAPRLPKPLRATGPITLTASSGSPAACPTTPVVPTAAPAWKPGCLPTKRDAAEATAIRRFVKERDIPWLVHLTSLDNLRGIIQAQALLSRQLLSRYELPHTPFDFQRIDGHRECVNLSISYYNFHMFYHRVYMSGVVNVLIYFQTDFLWKEGALFSPMNAASGWGAWVRPGLAGLAQLYANEIADKVGTQNRQGKPAWLPTNIQAEVLIPDGLPLPAVGAIIVRCPDHVALVRAVGWTGIIRCEPDKFAYRGEWIVKASSARSYIEF